MTHPFDIPDVWWWICVNAWRRICQYLRRHVHHKRQRMMCPDHLAAIECVYGCLPCEFDILACSLSPPIIHHRCLFTMAKSIDFQGAKLTIFCLIYHGWLEFSTNNQTTPHSENSESEKKKTSWNYYFYRWCQSTMAQQIKFVRITWK